jgi:hypothetical protein
LQNCSQVFDCRCCEIVAVIFLTVSKTIREMVELLCSRHPQAGYERRNLYSLEVSVYGEFNNVTNYEKLVTFVYLFIIAWSGNAVNRSNCSGGIV